MNRLLKFAFVAGVIGAADISFAREPIIVDSAILFAIDASSSVSPEEAVAQKTAYAAALRSPQFVRYALQDKHCIAIHYMEWSSVGDAKTVLPWQLVCSAEQAARAAQVIEDNGGGKRGPKARLRTSLSFAIDAASLSLDTIPYRARRRVIDISTDGTNNDGVAVTESRDRAAARGYVINAIGLSNAEHGVTSNLRAYLQQNVITGDQAIAVTPDRHSSYEDLVLMKILHETGSLTVSP